MQKSSNQYLVANHRSGSLYSQRRNTILTIVVADDHELVRESVAALLSYESDFQVLECASVRQLLKLVTRLQPAVVLVDVALDGVNAIKMTRRVKALSPATRVIVLSASVDEILVSGLIEAGIGGYVLKSDTTHNLIHAIRSGEGSDVYLSPNVTSLVKRQQKSQTGAHVAASVAVLLSPRQCEVLRLIAEGYSSTRIAAKLGVSESTVKSHRKNLMEKLNIHDKVSLTRYAIRVGLTRDQ
jgi:DNA-binding NarL/FixJ family response regulator